MMMKMKPLSDEIYAQVYADGIPCTHCGTLLVQPCAGQFARISFKRHVKRCAISTEEQRIYFKEKGYWPKKGK